MQMNWILGGGEIKTQNSDGNTDNQVRDGNHDDNNKVDSIANGSDNTNSSGTNTNNHGYNYNHR